MKDGQAAKIDKEENSENKTEMQVRGSWKCTERKATTTKKRLKRASANPKMHDPLKPSQKEIREHQESGHMPFRSWCPHCVRGRGKEMQHRRRSDEEESGIPEYHLDYCFPGDEGEDRLTILVVIERHTKMKKAIVVPQKGSTGSYATKKTIELIEECGDRDREILIKTYQEPAIKFLVGDICVKRIGAKTFREEAPMGQQGLERHRRKSRTSSGSVF